MNRNVLKSNYRILICFVFILLAVLGGCTVTPNERTVPAEGQQKEDTPSTESGADDFLDTSGVPKINLNNMTREELLATIPEFGNRMVREFFEYQPYISIGAYIDN